MALVDAPIGFALAAGTVAAFNPCGFAMLPAYLSFFVTGTDDDRGRSPVARALLVTAAMTVGFVAVFGLAGLAIEGASLAVGQWTPWITLLIGMAMVPLGVAMLGGRDIKVRLPRLQRGGKNRGLVSMTLFGASYATVSLSCTLPIFLTAVTGSFRDGNVIGGLATYIAYAAGMGLVVAVLTVALALARHGAVRKVRIMLPYLNRVGGALLIVTGGYVAYYGYFEIRVLRGDTVPAGPVDWVTDWSANLSAKLDSIGAVALLTTLAILIGMAGLVRRWRSASRRRTEHHHAATPETDDATTPAAATTPATTTAAIPFNGRGPTPTKRDTPPPSLSEAIDH